MIKVEINYQIKVPLSYEALFKRLTQATLRLLKIRGNFTLSVVFVSPREIKFLNKKYRSQNKATDVLSFGEVNEIAICYAQAVRQAKALGHSVNQEVAWLFIHGLLHLLGLTHETEKKYQRMVKLQQKILDG